MAGAAGCVDDHAGEAGSGPAPIVEVAAVVETEPVPGARDAADDAAIWIHPDDPALSTVIATDKTSGLGVYDLAGAEIHFYADSRPNNVDVRYGFRLGEDLVDVAVTSDREANAIRVYAIDTNSRGLMDVSDHGIQLDFVPYGLCLHAPEERLHAVVTGREGGAQQWEIDGSSGVALGRHVRDLRVQTTAEGCVVDDVGSTLFLAEEERGIWAMDVESSAAMRLVVGVAEDGPLTGDVEGLALYQLQDGDGYLIASDQGRDRFVVYELGSLEHVGSFEVARGEVDEVSHSDGIDATSVPLDDRFPAGLFVAQDDDNDDGNQNFKFVSWQDIAEAMDLGLRNPTDPRATSRRR